MTRDLAHSAAIAILRKESEMERDERAQRRATKELAKLFVMFGLNSDTAKAVAAKWVGRATEEVVLGLSPMLRDTI